MVENPKACVFYTDYICYEMDVVQACISSGSIGVLSRVIHSVEDSSDVVNSSLVKKAGQSLAWLVVLIRREKLSNISKRDNRSLQFYYFAWLYGNKGHCWKSYW